MSLGPGRHHGVSEGIPHNWPSQPKFGSDQFHPRLPSPGIGRFHAAQPQDSQAQGISPKGPRVKSEIEQRSKLYKGSKNKTGSKSARKPDSKMFELASPLKVACSDTKKAAL